MRAWMLAIPLLLSEGCAATVVSLQVVNAEQSLERARAKGAAQGAPYEFTMAVRYLEKSREEVADAELGTADALARQSEVWSQRAIDYARLGRRPGVRLDELPDDLR